MAQKSNPLFIGNSYLSLEGNNVKHPALINKYATINISKTNDAPIGLIGVDLETNHLTAELKLLGFYYKGEYRYYTNDFLNALMMFVKLAKREKLALAYWNRLDSFIIFKQFLLRVTKKQQIDAIARFGRVSGEWDTTRGGWAVSPVIEVFIDEETTFGIIQAIRSSIQFFIRKGEKLHKIWAFDIAQLYQGRLEKEAEKRLPYYSKVDKSAHLVDWGRFHTDKFYKNEIVLKSNELDARAVYDLGRIIQEDFFKAFNKYPRSLVSQGSLARSSIIARIDSNLNHDKEALTNAVKSISIANFLDKWVETYGEEFVKDFYSMTTESYSGGLIESVKYGYSAEGYQADISSAYPAVIRELWDLTDAKITRGTGNPPRLKNSYCFIRGELNIPENVNFSPVAVRNPLFTETIIHPVGKFVASYTLAERDFLEEQGATFGSESWFNIETTGKISPLAQVCNDFLELRKKFKKEKNSSEYMAKISANSLYGLLYEAVDTYSEIGGEIIRDGYRAGEFWNPIFASIITSETRIKLARASYEIEKRGGKVILLMTDSVLWEGKFEQLPSELWREEKTTGFFEKPKKVNEIICLGSGRYGYKENEHTYITKRRGINAEEIQESEGVELTEFEWLSILKRNRDKKADDLKIKSRVLVSAGLVLNDRRFTMLDLGKVVELKRDIQLIVGSKKRFIDGKITIPRLIDGLINTRPFYIYPEAFNVESIDLSQKELRDLMLERPYITTGERAKMRQRDNKRKNRLINGRKEVDNYEKLRLIGLLPDIARKFRYMNIEKIKAFITIEQWEELKDLK